MLAFCGQDRALIDANGLVLVGSHDGTLYALNPDGSLKWKFETGGSTRSTPIIDENGIIYFVADFEAPWPYSYLYALEIIDNEPPNTPNINGPLNGNIDTSYTYQIIHQS